MTAVAPDDCRRMAGLAVSARRKARPRPAFREAIEAAPAVAVTPPPISHAGWQPNVFARLVGSALTAAIAVN